MIPYGRHDISPEDIQAVATVLRGEWLTTGPTVEHFESELSRQIGGVPTVAVSSGTAALHTAYAAAGLGPGDEVITPPLTFAATQAALVHLGATPVFADIEPETGNIDPKAVEAAVGPRTAAIVAVDYAGHPADMTALREIANRHGLLLVEDSAHSLGSLHRGQPVGSIADITTFSFFPTKNITTGEGGAVATSDSGILERARRFSRQGLIRDPNLFRIRSEGPWHQEIHEVGLNYRMSDIHAALGVSQLSRLNQFKEVRADLKYLYDEVLSKHASVTVPTQHSFADPMWHLYPARVPSGLRQELFSQLRDLGVGVQVNYLPAYRHPALEQFANGMEFPVAEDFYAREISLPLHCKLEPTTAHFIAMQVVKLLSKLEGARDSLN